MNSLKISVDVVKKTWLENYKLCKDEAEKRLMEKLLYELVGNILYALIISEVEE